jgi:pimeloyl-ACP methyl ester carboxylesterase
MAGCSRRLLARSAACILTLFLSACASAAARPPVVVSPPLELYVEKFGSGPPLVALHGFGGSTYSWHAIRDVLSTSNTVYAFDLKGFGKSPKPRDGKYSVYDQAALVLDFIARNNLTNVTLLGHSFGGGVALAAAAELEERHPGVLSKLVLIDAASYKQGLPWFVDILRWPILGSLSQQILTERKQIRIVLEHCYLNKKLVTKDQIESYVAPLFLPGAKYALRETAEQIIPKNIAVLNARYPHIKVPTLILWGRQDRVVPLVNGERLSKAIPNSTLVVLENTGHIPHEETPQLVRKPLADFLR